MLTKLVVAAGVLYLGVRVYMGAWGSKLGPTTTPAPPAGDDPE